MSISLTLQNFGSSASADTITSIIDGDTYSWRLDDTLDSGLIMYTSSNLNPIEPFTLATINFDDGSTEKMWVAEDNVMLLSKIGNTRTYQHTLKLVELTKILEKIVIPGLCLTPVNIDSSTPAYTSLYKQFKRALLNLSLPNYYIGLEESSTIDTTLLTERDPETFVFSHSTAREILDEIFSTVDSRVIVDDVTYNSSIKVITLKINYIKMVSESTIVLSNNVYHKIISESAANSVESYAGEIYSAVESAMCDNEISIVDTFKANDAVATSSNRVMSLPYPIQYPTKFRLMYTGTNKMTVTYKYYPFGSATKKTGTIDYAMNGIWFDAMDYFVDYEYWQVLSQTDQNKTLYYVRGATEVDVSRTYKSLIVTRNVLATVFSELFGTWWNANKDSIRSYLYNNAGTYLESGTLSEDALTQQIANVDADQCIFDISYIGEIDGLTTSSKKEDRNWFERSLRVVDNQRANVLDLQRYGRNLEGKISRTGNDVYYIDCDVDSYANILPLLTKINEYNSVIYQVDISRHTDTDTWYEVRYYLSKNFNNLNERISLKREKRIYSIPTKGYQVTLQNKELIIIGDKNYEGEDFTLTNSTDTTEYQMAKVVAGTSGQVTNAFIEIQTDTDTLVPDPLLKKNFVLPAACYGAGNTINFVCKFYDNASAGLSIDTTSYGGINWYGGKKVSYNRYTNEYGFAQEPKVEWGHFTNARTTAGIQVQPVRKKSGANFAEDATILFDNKFYGFYKDPSEALCFQKTICLEPGSEDVIIGCLPDINSLFKDVGDIYIYVQQTWREGGSYRPGDRKVRYDTTKGDYRMILDPIVSVNTDTNTVDISIASYLSRYNFALGDVDGNMYVAVNGMAYTPTLLKLARRRV